MKKKIKEPERVDLSEDEINNLQTQIQKSNLSKDNQDLLIKMVQGFVWLNRMLSAKKLSMRKLMRLFGFKTEKKSKSGKDDDKDNKGGASSGGRNNKGHGKNGRDKYSGAKRVFHEHQELSAGDRCPSCKRGNLYEVKPGIFVHVKGSPPLNATIHEAQKLRCNTCGEIFTANVPKEVRKQKYDETADVTIALAKYGMGIPFYRLGKWQQYLGIPLPSSTGWDRVEHLTSSIYPVYNELIKEASKGEVSFIDDTAGKILDLRKELVKNKSKRTGI